MNRPHATEPPLQSRDSALIAFDEQLRQADAGTSAGGGRDAQGDEAPADLVECLRLIEQVWPRGSQRPAQSTNLPAHIGRFEIERVLGSGGFGIVYLARDPLLDRQVALKVPRLHALASEGLCERFRREARAAAALDHPNIVPVHETGEDGPLCYMACAYCEGPSLAQWLAFQSQDVPPRLAALVVRQLAVAMHYSHSRGILHRDLKPSNVLLFPLPDAPGEPIGELPFVPRIVDFGLAHLEEEELEATGTSGVIGTPLYMAPEQAVGADQIGPPADLYAIGVILYELLCRRPPFTGTSPLEVLDQLRNAEPCAIRKKRPDVPHNLETICLRCLQKRPEERYATGQALAEDLARFLDGDEIVARPVSRATRLLRWCQQPQRIREAGLTVIAVNITFPISVLLELFMVHAGTVVSRPIGFDAATWYGTSLAIAFGFHGPLIVVGRAVIAQHVWAVWLSLITGLAMTVQAVAFMLGLIPLGATGWDDVTSFRVVFPQIGLLFLLQSIYSAFALIALTSAKRSQSLATAIP